MQRVFLTLHILLVLLLSSFFSLGCTVKAVRNGPPLNARARWVLLPFNNHSQTPQAGERIESILQTLLEVHGVINLKDYPSQSDEELPELNDKRRLEKATAWAKAERFTYGVTGSVEEWRYRGLDGQPTVGISIRVIDLANLKVVYTASGARSGWSREPVSGVAQKLLEEMLSKLKLKN